MRWRIARGPTGIRNWGRKREAVWCCAKQRGARGEIEAGAVVERVEPLPRTATHEEVTGHADAVELEPAAATDLEHDAR